MGKMAVEIGATALNQYGGGWTRSRSRCSLEFQVLSRPGPQINIWLLHKLQGATKLLKRRKVIFSLSFAAAKLCSSASTAPPNAPPESAHCWWYPPPTAFPPSPAASVGRWCLWERTDRLLWFAWSGYLHISLFTLIAPHVNKMGGRQICMPLSATTQRKIGKGNIIWNLESFTKIYRCKLFLSGLIYIFLMDILWRFFLC